MTIRRFFLYPDHPRFDKMAEKCRIAAVAQCWLFLHRGERFSPRMNKQKKEIKSWEKLSESTWEQPTVVSQ